VEARQASISEAELEVLKVLWDNGSATVRALHERLRRQGRRWAYTTVLTLVQRLEAKGYVTSDKSALAHVFRPALTRDKLLRRRLKDLANQLCEGAATPLVLALVEAQRFTSEEINQFRQLLDQLETKKKSPRS
jgi:predicted transcriptional regulator